MSGGLTLDEATERLAVGRAALEDGAYALARERLSEVLDGAPDRRRECEAALWLAQVAMAEGKNEEAIGLLKEFGKSVRAAGLAAQFALAEARALAAAERPEEALDALAGFEGKYAGERSVAEAMRVRMEVLAGLGRWKEAQGQAEAIEVYAEEQGATAKGAAVKGWADVAPEAWFALAARLADAGKRTEARAVLERVAGRIGGDVKWTGLAEWRIAELRLAEGVLSPAENWVARLEVMTNWPAAVRSGGFRVAARALALETNATAALAAVERAVDYAEDPQDRLEAQVLQARLLGESGRLEEGAELLRSVAGRIPDESRAAELQLQLANWLEQAGQGESAEAEYRAWLEAFDGEALSGAALQGLSRVLAAEGRLEEAADVLGRAVAVEPEGVSRRALRLEEARLLAECGRHARAVEEYAAVVSEAPAGSVEAGQARLLGAESKLALGLEKEAEIEWLDLSRSRPETAASRAAMARLGKMYEERGALETAMEQYGRLIETCQDPERCAAALMARGLIRYRLGAFQTALDDFGRIRGEFAATLQAPRALFMSGWCLYLLGKDEEALAACEGFLTEFPNSEFAPDVRFWLGENAFNEGNYATAETRFAAMAREYPKSARAADALYWAGRAAAARFDYLAANEHFNALMAGYPDSPRMAETLLAQGDVLSELGQFALAIVAFDEVIGSFPQSPEAMMARGRKGDCQFTLGAEDPGRYEEALMSYRTLADFAGAPFDLSLQARYKIGRCMEKIGTAGTALERYLETMYLYLQEARPAPEATVWFTRAAFSAAALQERAADWTAALNTYRRVVEAGVPASAEAKARMGRIRNEHWIREE